jgi:hypothetical protein
MIDYVDYRVAPFLIVGVLLLPFVVYWLYRYSERKRGR